MPKSKSRKRRAETTETPHRRALPRWRRRLGWGLALAGVVLFLLGNVGARTGIALPFDPHHLLTQWGGGIAAIVGLLVATGLR